MAQAKNYTEEMVNTMTEQYAANPTRETVDALADQFGKTTRSIIAKLSREGVYVAQPRTTKSGEPIVGIALEKNMGEIIPGFLESSNVEITDELVKMLKYQQAYSGNSRLLQTEIDITKRLIDR